VVTQIPKEEINGFITKSSISYAVVNKQKISRMKSTVKTLIAFVLFIIIFNIIRYSIESDRKQNFIDSLDKMNGDLIGEITSKDSMQQGVCLLKLKLLKNEIGDLDLSENNLFYITIKDIEAELAIICASRYNVGDSIILNSKERLVRNFRQGTEIHRISFDSIFIYRRAPVYYEASRKRTLK